MADLHRRAGISGGRTLRLRISLDLQDAVGLTAISRVDWVTISFGPVVSSLNYGADAKPDQVFVVTGGRDFR